MADEIVTEFVAEATDFLNGLERDLVEVDEGTNLTRVIAETFRAFHTIKGTASFLGFEKVRGLSHAAEDVLSAIRDSEIVWDRRVTDVLLDVLDALRGMVKLAEATGKDGDEPYAELIGRLRAALEPGCKGCDEVLGQSRDGSREVEAAASDPPQQMAAPVAPPRQGSAPSQPAPGTVSAPASPVAAGPTAERKAAFQPLAAPPKRVRPPQPATPPPAPETAARAPGRDASLAPPVAAPGSEPAGRTDAPNAESHEAASSLRVPVQVLDRLMNLVGELVLARNQLLCHEATREDARLTATSQRIHQLTAGLQEAVMKSRMQPIDFVFSRLPRVARDTADSCGKQARLVTSGRDTELDKTLLEAVKDPLTHVVRNAIDHGLETPSQRAAAGKPPEGTVAVRAFHDGGQVVIEIEDDGAGVHLDKVRKKAVALGMLSADEAARLADVEVVDLVFRPGFSTADQVTSISGRGVGMDVVRTNVERIGGSVELVSRPGRGTVCRMRVPLTLVIVPSLVVSSGGEHYAIPQASLTELVRVGAEREARMVVDVQGTTVLRLRGALLPLLDLARELKTGEVRRARDGALSVVVLASQGGPFGLLVDDVADTEEIVVKPLARHLQQLGVFSGATVRGDGRVALVLDVAGLARRAGVLDGQASAGRGAAAATGTARRPYLVLRGQDDGRLAIPLGRVTRVEEIAPSRVERIGGEEALQYRGAILPLVRLSQALVERRVLPRNPAAPTSDSLHVVVQTYAGREVGLVVDSVLDVVEDDAAIDAARARPGVAGCAVIQGRITEILDTDCLLAAQLGPASAEAARA